MKTQDVVNHFGSVAALAAALGVRRQAIYQWGEQVPEGRRFEIEVKSGGVFKATNDSACQQAA